MSVNISVEVSNVIIRMDKLLKDIGFVQEVVIFDSDEMINEIVLRARDSAPWDTGRHAESIHGEGSFPSYSIIADAINDYGQYYSAYVEFGTSKMPARPHIIPAANEVTDEYKNKIREDVVKALKG